MEEPTLNELNAMAKLTRELQTKGKFTKKSFMKANDLGLITFEGLTDRGDFVRSEVPDGLIERRRCRKTGELMSIYDAEAQGQSFDFTDAKYTVMCDPHGTVVTVPDMKSAKILMATPEDVCEFCYETVHGEEPNPKKPHNQIQGGLAAGRKPSEFDAKELRMGVKVELEHTKDRKLAREIAMDHLVEHPKYYTALLKMERGLEAKKKRRKGRVTVPLGPGPKKRAVRGLITKARTLWDRYYAKPTKANIRAFAKHYEVMSVQLIHHPSKMLKKELRASEKVLAEETASHGLRLDGEDSKALRRKRNPIAGKELDIRAAMDLLELKPDSTEAEVRAEARRGMMLYGPTGAAPIRPSIATHGRRRGQEAASVRGRSVTDKELRALIEESEEVMLDWIERGRPMDEVGEWQPWVPPISKLEAKRLGLYKELRIEPGATREEIRSATRRMRWKLRDLDPDTADSKFIRTLRVEEILLGLLDAEEIFAPAAGASIHEAMDESLRARYADPPSTILRKAQKNLKKLGYYTGWQTSRMTPETEDSIRAFQSERGFEGDGLLTPETEEALVEEARVARRR